MSPRGFRCRRNRLARVLSASQGGGEGGKIMHVPSALEGAGRPAVPASSLAKTLDVLVGNLP